MHVDSHQIILETTWGWGLGYARRGRLWEREWHVDGWMRRALTERRRDGCEQEMKGVNVDSWKENEYGTKHKWDRAG
eukprot:2807747-Rhodomonas_salina.1